MWYQRTISLVRPATTSSAFFYSERFLFFFRCQFFFKSFSWVTDTRVTSVIAWHGSYAPYPHIWVEPMQCTTKLTTNWHSYQPSSHGAIISLRQESICDPLTLTGWIKFLSKFFSSPQILTRCQHQNVRSGRPLSPLPSPPPPHIENLRFQQIWTQYQKLVGDPCPLPPPCREFGISADLDSASKVGDGPPPPNAI